MQAVGMPGAGWIASTVDEYADAAVQAAHDLQHLATLREELRPRMLSSRLCDSPAFVSRLELTYRNMWHAWLDGQKLDEHEKKDALQQISGLA